MKGVPDCYVKRFREPLKAGLFLPTAFYDMTGNMNAALLLAQIYYWHRPNSKGVSKMQHEFEGKNWLRKSHHEWWDEIRLKAGQVRHALRLLKQLQLVEVETRARFEGRQTIIIRLKYTEFFQAFDAVQVSESTPDYTAAGVEIDRAGVEIDRAGVEIDRAGVEIDRAGVDNELPSIVTETTHRLHKDHSETTHIRERPAPDQPTNIQVATDLSETPLTSELWPDAEQVQEVFNASRDACAANKMPDAFWDEHEELLWLDRLTRATGITDAKGARRLFGACVIGNRSHKEKNGHRAAWAKYAQYTPTPKGLMRPNSRGEPRALAVLEFASTLGDDEVYELKPREPRKWNTARAGAISATAADG